MQITAEPVPPCQVRLTIVVPESRVEQAVTRAAQEIGRRLKIRGYRPGKMPVAAVIARVGEEPIREEAMDTLVRAVVRDAIEAEHLEPSAPASVDILEQQPLTLAAVVPLQPTVELGDYPALLRVPEIEPRVVTEEDVDAVVDRFRQRLAHLESVNRPAAPGDFVTARLVGTRDGAIVYEDEGLTLQLDEAGARSAHVPPDLVTALAGHSAGDEPFVFQARYPDDWPQPELQGADVAFEAEITQVAEYALPDIDDTFAEQAGAESVAELRTRVRDSLVERTQADAREAQLEAALSKLVELAEITYPPALLETETADLVADLRTRVERQGLQWERWLELQRRDEDAIWSDLEKEARERLERRLAISTFVRREGIAVGDDEVGRLVGQLREAARADRRRLPKDSELRNQMFHRLLTERSLSRLLEIAASPAAS